MKKEFTCIVCPNGCDITVETVESTKERVCENDRPYVITGAACKRGEAYVLQELTDPRRTISTSVLVKNGEMPLVSVRLTRPIPLEKIPQAVREIHCLTPQAPVYSGDVLIKGLLGHDCDVIATRTVMPA